MRVRFSSPKIIHQTWKERKLPEKCVDYVSAWKSLHRDFEYIFYLDEDLREAVKKYTPKFISLYDAMKRNIERVDFARYSILYGIGGVYADLDTLPLRSIEPWLEKGKVVLGREPLEHSRTLYGREIVLCNAFMISPPKEEFWMGLMEYISKNYDPNSDPVTNTGPIAMTLYLEKNPEVAKDIIITDPCVFFSLTNGFTRKSQLGFSGISRFCDLENPSSPEKTPFVVHAWHNEWTKTKAQKVVVEGYRSIKSLILDSEKNTQTDEPSHVIKYGLDKNPCFFFIAVFGIILFVILLLKRRRQ